jgi:hypothetical protein
LIATVAWCFYSLRPDHSLGEHPTMPLQAKNLRMPTPQPRELAPWESTAENTPPLPPGFIPARLVNPYRPVPNIPPPPKEPANPIRNFPPMQNPHGVEGMRGPRPAELDARTPPGKP